MARIYYLTFENISITNANGDHDLFYVAPAANKPIEIHEIVLTNTSNTDVGDAQEEMLRLELIKGFTAASTGGTDVTETGLGRADSADANPGFSARTVDTGVATTGTSFVMRAESFNIRSGWLYQPLPEDRFRVHAGDTSIVLRLMAAVTDDITMSGTMTLAEFG